MFLSHYCIKLPRTTVWTNRCPRGTQRTPSLGVSGSKRRITNALMWHSSTMRCGTNDSLSVQ